MEKGKKPLHSLVGGELKKMGKMGRSYSIQPDFTIKAQNRVRILKMNLSVQGTRAKRNLPGQSTFARYRYVPI